LNDGLLPLKMDQHHDNATMNATAVEPYVMDMTSFYALLLCTILTYAFAASIAIALIFTCIHVKTHDKHPVRRLDLSDIAEMNDKELRKLREELTIEEKKRKGEYVGPKWRDQARNRN
jgi:hypothetical protein